jgi:uncharacterized protein YjbJ (UPF0337 family)
MRGALPQSTVVCRFQDIEEEFSWRFRDIAIFSSVPLSGSDSTVGRFIGHITKNAVGGLMNWDQAKGNWKQMKGRIKEQWGKLTDDELDQIEGKRDQLVGKIQKQYGVTKEEAERQVGDWEGRF